eukprot:CAMPEP_0185330796 /NCGR_PEP_ID=MMETSP1363-20130426/77973_1 /TAXON_ID=38817 /ORGANISM="Gephyrocapsa oceanica, Strain RCC1303" /LENGTH=53 /DNA_ID=CAMNT_0027929655 /DNA_START=24 /DNA_END=181 /DNA_ORIENTATION=-
MTSSALVHARCSSGVSAAKTQCRPGVAISKPCPFGVGAMVTVSATETSTAPLR